MKQKLLYLFSALLLSQVLHAQISGTDSVRWEPLLTHDVNTLSWKPKTTLPPGANAAVVFGDPAKGSYDFYGNFPANYTVPMHWHTNDCNVVMIKGDMTIQRDGYKDVTIKEGGFFYLPGKMQYVAKCPTGCIFLVHGEKPFDIFYRNAKDDPRTNTSH